VGSLAGRLMRRGEAIGATLKESGGPVVDLEQPLDPPAPSLIPIARLVQERSPLGPGCLAERGGEDRLITHRIRSRGGSIELRRHLDCGLYRNYRICATALVTNRKSLVRVVPDDGRDHDRPTIRQPEGPHEKAPNRTRPRRRGGTRRRNARDGPGCQEE